MSGIAFLFLHLLKSQSRFLVLGRNRMFSSTKREPFQTETDFRKLGRILMDRFFNEIMEYSGGLFVVKFLHKIEILV